MVSILSDDADKSLYTFTISSRPAPNDTTPPRVSKFEINGDEVEPTILVGKAA